VAQLVEHALPKPESCVRMLGVYGLVKGNSPRTVRPFTRHRCSTNCQSSRAVHGASKRR